MGLIQIFILSNSTSKTPSLQKDSIVSFIFLDGARIYS